MLDQKPTKRVSSGELSPPLPCSTTDCLEHDPSQTLSELVTGLWNLDALTAGLHPEELARRARASRP